MQSQSLKAILFIVLAALFAIYLGVATATAQFEAIAWVVGFLCIGGILSLGKAVWTLIPCTLILQGTINALPGSPPAWVIGALITAGIYTMRFAMRKVPASFKFDGLDFVMLLQVLAVLQAFVRAPAGVMFLGGESVGGKSYFVFGFAFLAYFVLAVTDTDMKTVKRAVYVMITFTILDGLIALVGDYSSSLSMAILHIYSNSNVDVARAGDQMWDLSRSRGGQGFTLLGKAIVVPCFTLIRPLLAFNPLRPWLPIMVAFGTALVFMSGFRTNLTYLFVVFCLASLLRRKVADIFAVVIGAVTALALVILTGQLRSLPFGVQRILSVLPVDVSSEARMDAENSTTWRTEMWVLALTTDRYIHNKILGDGFGMSGYEMNAKFNAELGLSDFEGQEQMLATGTYHGFHVETIRFTGALGLVCAIIMMFYTMRRTIIILLYYRGREEFGYLCYLLIPFMIYPWWSLLIFGSYRAEFPQYLAMAGMVKLVDKLRRREMAEAKEEEPENAPLPQPGARMPFPRPVFGSARNPAG